MKAAEVLDKYDIKFVVCCNTVGNALVVDGEAGQPLIAPKGGFSGHAGGCAKQSRRPRLASVRQMFLALRNDVADVAVVGAGGHRQRHGRRRVHPLQRKRRARQRPETARPPTSLFWRVRKGADFPATEPPDAFSEGGGVVFASESGKYFSATPARRESRARLL